jgi:hypothetical protein
MAFLQAWLIRGVVREILPLVVDTVRSQLRGRQPAPAAEAGPPPPAINAETEARFNALQDDLRQLERGLRNAQDDLGAKLDRLAFWNRILAAATAVLLAVVVYLLIRG